MPEKIKAPITKGDKIGTVSISKNGTVIKEIDIIVSQDIERLTYSDGLKEIISKW